MRARGTLVALAPRAASVLVARALVARVLCASVLCAGVLCAGCKHSNGLKDGGASDGGRGDGGPAGGDGGPAGSDGGPGGSDGGPGPSDGGPTAFDLGPSPGDGAACGYQSRGRSLHVAAGIDVCVPPQVCAPETCPPQLGQCVNGQCVFGAGYSGVATLPQAWATYYCQLSTGGCHGVTQIEFPEVTAQEVAANLGRSICETSASAECIGIMATSPMLVGNAQTAIDPVSGKQVKDWGLGLTEASGLCYRITGPGGSAIVAVTDRCGGYCKCNGSAYQECGACANATDLTPNCPCVGTAGTAFPQCCGAGPGCGPVNAACDWCASSNHPHFDLDTATFNWVCGEKAIQGSCQLSAAAYVPCLTPKAWPPN